MKRQYWSWKSLVLVFLGTGLALGQQLQSAHGNSKTKRQPETMPGEVIVGMKKGLGLTSAKSLIQSSVAQVFGAHQLVSLEALSTDQNVQVLKIKDAHKISSVISQLQQNPEVRYAEPNFIYRTMAAPNDPEFARQWDMLNTGQRDKPQSEATPTNPGQLGTPGSDINVMNLWNQGITGQQNFLVAVIDTGIDYNHPDLQANIYTNPGEIAGNGIDDDSNGVIDDVHGASFMGATPVGNAMDDVDHGTHCAGTIGASGNNGIGIAGVNWNISMVPVKFLGTAGGTTAGAINSINYATSLGVKVMSNSWGGGGFSQALFDAIKDARDAGILFVAAAGNNASDNDAVVTYPANYALENVVSVAATDNRDALAYFSNYGRTKVHVAAPGMNILSTVRNSAYKIFSGTSMACPHISGMAALMWSADPTLTFAQIKTRLIETSVPKTPLRTKVVSRGRVDMTNAYNSVIPPSNEPPASAWIKQAFSSESAHPYADNLNQTFEIHVPGAQYIRVVFDQLDMEAGYDQLMVENPTGDVMETITGVRASGYTSEYVSGDRLILRLKSDISDVRYGFKIAEIEVIQ